MNEEKFSKIYFPSEDQKLWLIQRSTTQNLWDGPFKKPRLQSDNCNILEDARIPGSIPKAEAYHNRDIERLQLFPLFNIKISNNSEDAKKAVILYGCR